jgi:RimJ/RimL family protein N-acetyltransferase
MLAPPDNETTVLAVLADRFSLPMELLEPGALTITEVPGAALPVRTFERAGGVVVAVAPEHAELVRRELVGPGTYRLGLDTVARWLAAKVFTGVARTGTDIAEPQVPVIMIDATDERLPAWVHGHFTGEAWVVLDEDQNVLSTAVLKRYDNRLREIAVGTSEAARGRGLARSVVAAAARAVLAEGRAVLYNHDEDNYASARVAEAVGLRELGRFSNVVPDRATMPD